MGGLIWSGLGALGLIWGLIRGNTAGWSSPSVYLPLAGGAAALVLFVLWERRTRAPMVPMSLFRNPAFGAANAAGILMTASIFGAAFFFAQYLQAGLGEDPLTAGLRMLPWTATLFLVAPGARRMNAPSRSPLIICSGRGEPVGSGQCSRWSRAPMTCWGSVRVLKSG